MESRSCHQCGEAFYGRSDKKFCDEYCRNLHNNKLNSDITNYMRNINNALRKNRRTLEAFYLNNSKRIRWQQLALEGFDFSVHTHFQPSKRGGQWLYCYEFGYIYCKPDIILIKKRKLPSAQ